jgi:hypothetical protein
MLRIITDGEDVHRIESADGTPVGWIRGRAVGFWGFSAEAQAVSAAAAAWRSLDGSLGRQFPGRVQHALVPERVHVLDGDACAWVADGDRRFARLYRRAVGGDWGDGGDRPFAIEFELPSYASAGIVIAAAHLLGAVIENQLDPRATGGANPPPASAIGGASTSVSAA